jgi:hypothetical protein
MVSEPPRSGEPPASAASTTPKRGSANCAAGFSHRVGRYTTDQRGPRRPWAANPHPTASCTLCPGGWRDPAHPSTMQADQRNAS